MSAPAAAPALRPSRRRSDFAQSRRAVAAYRYVTREFDPEDELFFV